MENFKILLSNDKQSVPHVNNDITNGKHVFLFVFMDGCGPCNQTIPEWDALKPHASKFENVSLARVNNTLFENLKNAGKEPAGYPTLRYIKNGKAEEFENSGLSNMKRDKGSFLKWIESKASSKSKNKSKSKSKSKVGGRSRKRKQKRKSRKNKRR